MKRIIAFLMLVSLTLSLIACSGNSENVPDGMQAASVEGAKYDLFVPGGWIVTAENGISGAYYSNADKSNISVSCFYPEENMASIADYWARAKESYINTYKNFEATEEEIQTILGEVAAYRYVFSADIDGKSYKFMQIVTVHDNMFYTLTYTAEADKYELHTEDLQKVISEFKFK